MWGIDSKEKLIELMHDYKNLVFSICLKMTGDYFTAEDITQETFITAYQHLSEVEKDNAKAWLCRVASNKCIDYLRAADRRMVATADDEMPESKAPGREGPLDMYVAKSLLKDFADSCDELKEPYRTVAHMRFEEGLSAKEIAMKLGVPLKTIQTHIFRAREMLRKKIRKEDLMA